MKYGETLRQRSIPAWSAYNIDYDDIKRLIKERTTPGKGKSISIPGKGDEKLLDFEDTLFHILVDQHERIGLFVKTKAGEIQRRLDHARKQLKQLSSRRITAADHRIPIGRLERYGKLENDVLKAGDEIRSLARFTGTQRTAFRKLLKKYKKWTESVDLEIRFREEVLDEPKSFTHLDLGPLLDDYSATLQSIRSLYENGLQQSPVKKSVKEAHAAPPVTEQLRNALQDRSRVDFDTAIATVPLGDHGEVANYFVHPENVVELQVSLLQYMQYFTSRSRANSIATPVTPATPRRQSATPTDREADYFMLVADNLERFAQKQSTITVSQREHAPGNSPQIAKAAIRWTDAEDAVVSTRAGPSKIKSATLKRKHVESFFDREASLPKKVEMADSSAASIRSDILKDTTVRPLYKLSTCRSRFVGLNEGARSLTLATLDSSITMQSASSGGEVSDFAFAVLQVRKEGEGPNSLLNFLDQSHLVERVRGFSLQYHALWQTCKPKISAPFWIPMLSHDIRKLPPPAIKTQNGSGSGSQSATQGTASTNSIRGFNDSTTAVESSRPDSSLMETQMEAPPLRAFRKKRRRLTYAEREVQQQRYWSEYDHPEELGEGADAYVIYIDPNEKSTLDRLFGKLGGLFSQRRSSDEEEPLLNSPATPDDDTSDEEDNFRARRGYGTLTRPASRGQVPWRPAVPQPQFLPQVTGICFFASLSILMVAYILASTSKHKFAAEADFGIVFAVACGLALAVIGFIPMLRRTEEGTWVAFGVAVGVMVVNIVASGLLLAWVLG